MDILRHPKNPLITPADVKPFHDDFEVIGAFNAGVAVYQGETILLLRVAERPISRDENIVKVPVYDPEKSALEIIDLRKDDPTYEFSDPRVIKKVDDRHDFVYLTSLSYVRIARSRDGEHFTIDVQAFIYPFNEYQTFGIEDPRCSEINGKFYITFSSVSPYGICDSLVVTEDFVSYQSLGNIFAPENKDVVLFPEKINGAYYALHRPSLKSVGEFDVWIAKSPDLEAWGHHTHLFGVRNNHWDEQRIGASVPPIKTADGWLVIYHGANHQSRYCMGAVLLDLEDPYKVLARTDEPFMVPEVDYEQNGFFGEVVFGCGAYLENDVITMYYGVSDTSIASCQFSWQKLRELLKKE